MTVKGKQHDGSKAMQKAAIRNGRRLVQYVNDLLKSSTMLQGLEDAGQCDCDWNTLFDRRRLTSCFASNVPFNALTRQRKATKDDDSDELIELIRALLIDQYDRIKEWAIAGLKLDPVKQAHLVSEIMEKRWLDLVLLNLAFRSISSTSKKLVLANKQEIGVTDTRSLPGPPAVTLIRQHLTDWLIDHEYGDCELRLLRCYTLVAEQRYNSKNTPMSKFEVARNVLCKAMHSQLEEPAEKADMMSLSKFMNFSLRVSNTVPLLLPTINRFQRLRTVFIDRPYKTYNSRLYNLETIPVVVHNTPLWASWDPSTRAKHLQLIQMIGQGRLDLTKPIFVNLNSSSATGNAVDAAATIVRVQRIDHEEDKVVDTDVQPAVDVNETLNGAVVDTHATLPLLPASTSSGRKKAYGQQRKRKRGTKVKQLNGDGGEQNTEPGAPRQALAQSDDPNQVELVDSEPVDQPTTDEQRMQDAEAILLFSSGVRKSESSPSVKDNDQDRRVVRLDQDDQICINLTVLRATTDNANNSDLSIEEQAGANVGEQQEELVSGGIGTDRSVEGGGSAVQQDTPPLVTDVDQPEDHGDNQVSTKQKQQSDIVDQSGTAVKNDAVVIDWVHHIESESGKNLLADKIALARNLLSTKRIGKKERDELTNYCKEMERKLKSKQRLKKSKTKRTSLPKSQVKVAVAEKDQSKDEKKLTVKETSISTLQVKSSQPNNQQVEATPNKVESLTTMMTTKSTSNRNQDSAPTVPLIDESSIKSDRQVASSEEKCDQVDFVEPEEVWEDYTFICNDNFDAFITPKSAVKKSPMKAFNPKHVKSGKKRSPTSLNNKTSQSRVGPKKQHESACKDAVSGSKLTTTYAVKNNDLTEEARIAPSSMAQTSSDTKPGTSTSLVTSTNDSTRSFNGLDSQREKCYTKSNGHNLRHENVSQPENQLDPIIVPSTIASNRRNETIKTSHDTRTVFFSRRNGSALRSGQEIEERSSKYRQPGTERENTDYYRNWHFNANVQNRGTANSHQTVSNTIHPKFIATESSLLGNPLPTGYQQQARSFDHTPHLSYHKTSSTSQINVKATKGASRQETELKPVTNCTTFVDVSSVTASASTTSEKPLPPRAKECIYSSDHRKIIYTSRNNETSSQSSPIIKMAPSREAQSKPVNTPKQVVINTSCGNGSTSIRSIKPLMSVHTEVIPSEHSKQPNQHQTSTGHRNNTRTNFGQSLSSITDTKSQQEEIRIKPDAKPTSDVVNTIGAGVFASYSLGKQLSTDHQQVEIIDRSRHSTRKNTTVATRHSLPIINSVPEQEEQSNPVATSNPVTPNVNGTFTYARSAKPIDIKQTKPVDQQKSSPSSVSRNATSSQSSTRQEAEPKLVIVTSADSCCTKPLSIDPKAGQSSSNTTPTTRHHSSSVRNNYHETGRRYFDEYRPLGRNQRSSFDRSHRAQLPILYPVDPRPIQQQLQHSYYSHPSHNQSQWTNSCLGRGGAAYCPLELQPTTSNYYPCIYPVNYVPQQQQQPTQSGCNRSYDDCVYAAYLNQMYQSQLAATSISNPHYCQPTNVYPNPAINGSQMAPYHQYANYPGTSVSPNLNVVQQQSTSNQRPAEPTDERAASQPPAPSESVGDVGANMSSTQPTTSKPQSLSINSLSNITGWYSDNALLELSSGVTYQLERSAKLNTGQVRFMQHFCGLSSNDLSLLHTFPSLESDEEDKPSTCDLADTTDRQQSDDVLLIELQTGCFILVDNYRQLKQDRARKIRYRRGYSQSQSVMMSKLPRSSVQQACSQAQFAALATNTAGADHNSSIGQSQSRILMLPPGQVGKHERLAMRQVVIENFKASTKTESKSPGDLVNFSLPTKPRIDKPMVRRMRDAMSRPNGQVFWKQFDPLPSSTLYQTESDRVKQWSGWANKVISYLARRHLNQQQEDPGYDQIDPVSFQPEQCLEEDQALFDCDSFAFCHPNGTFSHQISPLALHPPNDLQSIGWHRVAILYWILTARLSNNDSRIRFVGKDDDILIDIDEMTHQSASLMMRQLLADLLIPVRQLELDEELIELLLINALLWNGDCHFVAATVGALSPSSQPEVPNLASTNGSSRMHQTMCIVWYKFVQKLTNRQQVKSHWQDVERLVNAIDLADDIVQGFDSMWPPVKTNVNSKTLDHVKASLFPWRGIQQQQVKPASDCTIL